MRVIGLDCATDNSRIGVALGEYEAEIVSVSRFEICSRARPAVSIVGEWLAGATQALLAVDAPLGWPTPLARALCGHNAGDAISATPNDMFRRETDRFVQRQVGKTPLDVGADRIARTAHAALGILADLRKATGAAVPLAWNPDSLTGIAAIEVYPAATLLVHGFRSSGYKQPQQVDERAEILSKLASVLALPTDTSQMAGNADVLDAVVCLLAAKDFLDGRAMKPVDADLAYQEGWIWAAPLGPRIEPSKPQRTIGRPRNVREDRYAASSEHIQDGVITDANGLTAGEVAHKRVLCPACRDKVFSSWPAGWDAHVGFKCSGAKGANAEARKADFKYRFGHLFC